MTAVLVTGASLGIGLEFARQYAAQTARVYACCRKPEKADTLKAVATSSKGEVPLQCDVRALRFMERIELHHRDVHPRRRHNRLESWWAAHR